MWLSSIYTKSLRDARIAILGWGFGIGLLMYTVFAAFPSLVTTEAARKALISLGPSFAWTAEPIKLDTAGGYTTFKYGFTILILALWPILVSSRMLRGDEERGVMDVMLALPKSRTQVVLEKIAAMWTALLAIGIIIGVLAYAGSSSVNGGLSLSDGLLFGFDLILISGFFGSVALLISQFTQSQGAASGIAGGLLFVAIVVDMIHRIVPNTEDISRLSPVYYYNLSKALIPSYGTNVGALIILLALTLLCNGAAIWFFLRRDIGSPVALPSWLRIGERPVSTERALPATAWSLRSVYLRSLARMSLPTMWWTLILGGFAAWTVFVVKQTESSLSTIYESSPILQTEISKVGGGDVAMNASILSFIFLFFPLLLMVYTITQASVWAADEENGRQELILATPQSRLTVLLARFGALATMTVLMSFVILAATAWGSAASGLKLDGGYLTAAILGFIPMGLLVAALGYLLSGWLRSAIDTGLLSFLLALWFFITFVGPGLNWPDSTLKLSAFYYYGTPLLHGLSVGNTVGIIALGLVALTLASVRFMRKDIGR